MAIERGFRVRPVKDDETREQIVLVEEATLRELRKISRLYGWVKWKLPEVEQKLHIASKLEAEVATMRKTLEVIEKKMESLDITEETLTKAAKYDEHLANTRKRVRRFREK